MSFITNFIYSCIGYRGNKYACYTREINKKERLLFESSECPICLEILISDEELIKMKCGCEYIYHKVCLESWISSRKHLNTLFCPTCQSEF